LRHPSAAITHYVFDDCPGSHAEKLQRVIVSGSRQGLSQRQHEAFEKLMAKLPPTCTVVHGGAAGVDAEAERWAIAHGILRETFKADWKTYGKRAGAIRNSAMLIAGADFVLAFPGPRSRGTWDMVNKARAARVETLIVRP